VTARATLPAADRPATVGATRQGGDLRDLPLDVGYLDVGTCVNRYGPPAGVRAALAAADPEALLVHPYGAEDDFVTSYARYLGVDPAHLVPGRGITEFIRTLSIVLPVDRVAVVTPDYTDTIRTFPLHLGPPNGAVDTIETRFQRVLDGMASFPYVMLSNPNNPLGLYIERSLLLHACRTHPDSVLIVDEAFVDFVAGGERLSLVHADVENLVVLRSPNKLFGIAGARTGALWTRNRELLARVRRMKLNWALSYLDATVARAALQERDWAQATRARLLRTAAVMEEMLLERFGMVVAGVPVHYRFVPSEDAAAVHDLFARHGVVVRVFSGDDPGRIAGVRVTAPRDSELDAIEAALA